MVEALGATHQAKPGHEEAIAAFQAAVRGLVEAGVVDPTAGDQIVPVQCAGGGDLRHNVMLGRPLGACATAISTLQPDGQPLIS